MGSSKEVKDIIRKAEFKGRSLLGRYEKDVLCNLVEALVRLQPNKIDELRYKDRGDLVWISENKNDPVWEGRGYARLIAGTKWWMRTNLNTLAIVDRAKKLVCFFGFLSTDLVITVERCDRSGRAMD